MTTQHTQGRLYAERDIINQRQHYLAHVSAMTKEGLQSKSDIAAELAHRDIVIAELLEALKLAHGALSQAAADLNDWGAYAPAHFQAKHKLADDVQAYVNAAESVRAAIAKATGEST